MKYVVAMYEKWCLEYLYLARTQSGLLEYDSKEAAEHACTDFNKRDANTIYIPLPDGETPPTNPLDALSGFFRR